MRAALVALLVLFSLTTKSHADVGPGDTGRDVVVVQTYLRSFGYVLPIDGVFGPRTTKAVRHFQKASGLQADGIVGAITMAALAGSDAIRIPAAEIRSGLRGLPFAPDGIAGCGEATWYRQQAGLPDQFDAIIYRESRCDNTVGNACCVGYLANYITSHLSKQSAYRPFIIAHCEVTGRADIQGPSPLQKQKQMCVSRIVFDISGMSPWAL